MNNRSCPGSIGRLERGAMLIIIIALIAAVAPPMSDVRTPVESPNGIGPRLTGKLEDVQALHNTLDVATLRSIREALGNLSANVEATSLFVATEPMSDGASRVLTIAVVPLDASATMGYASVGVSADGVTRRLEVWGHDLFEEAVWGDFAAQFRNRSAVIDAGSTLRPDQIDRLAQGLESGEIDGPIRALYSQRLQMRANSFRFTLLSRLGVGGEAPDAQWYRVWADSMTQLAASSDQFVGVFDVETMVSYRAAAEKGREIIARAAVARQDEDWEELRSTILGLNRGSCQICHQLSAPGFGSSTLYRDVQSNFERLGVRSDVLRVGVDVLGVPGHPMQSQRAADAIRAALMVLSNHLKST